MAIRILIADDHAVVRQGLRMFLGLDPELEVVGEASDGAEALRLARARHPIGGAREPPEGTRPDCAPA